VEEGVGELTDEHLALNTRVYCSLAALNADIDAKHHTDRHVGLVHIGSAEIRRGREAASM